MKSQAGSRRKAVAPQKQSRVSKFCQRVRAPLTARAAVAGPAVLSANAALRRALISVLNVQIFHAITEMRRGSIRTFSTRQRRKDFKR